jgi:alpha-galactosidase
VDAMRISWDIGANWSYARNFFQEVHGQQYFNNIWWQNDPDAIILRSDFNHMTTDELESLAFYMGMLGGAVNTSDLFHTMPEKNLEIFRMLEPADEKKTATFPFIENPGKIDVLVRELKPGKGWAVLFFNREDTPTTEQFSVKEITGISEASLFKWDTNGHQLIGKQENVLIQLRSRQSQLIYISADGQAPDDINFAGKRK